MVKLISITGKTISGEWGREDDTGTGVPILRTTNFTNDGKINFSNVVTRKLSKSNIKNKYLKPGDIIIEKSGGSDNQPVGRVVYFNGKPETYLFNNFTGLLRVKDTAQWYPQYVFWSLFANYKQGKTLLYQNRTTGLHNLRTDAYVKDTDIYARSLYEQKKISDLLNESKLVIEKQQHKLDKLDELIKARFVEMFGDLTINDRGWKTENFSCVFKSITSSKRILKSEWKSKGIPFLRVRDLVQLSEKGVLNNEFFISNELYSKLSDNDGVTKNGDILVSATSTLGKCYIINSNEQLYFKDADVLRFRPSNKINAVYFTECMNDHFIQKQIDHNLGVTTVKHFTIKAAKSILIRIPPLSLQNKFATFVQQVDKSKFENIVYLNKTLSMKILSQLGDGFRD